MSYHIGERVQALVKASGMPVAEFARRINTSRENAHRIFKRTSLDTDLLMTISQVLDHDFFRELSGELVGRNGSMEMEKGLLLTRLDEISAELKAIKDKLNLNDELL